MELEEFRCDLIALRKLYGILLGCEDFLQNSDMDERARLMLKNLLDDATEKVFETHLKIRDTAQSSFSNPSYPSKAEQFKAGQTVLVPGLHRASPGLSRLSSISSNKLENRKKPSQICYQSSIKLHDTIEVLGRDGDSQEQPRGELFSGHAERLLDKKQKGIEQFKYNQRQMYGNHPGIVNSVACRLSSSLVSVDGKPRHNLDTQVEKSGDEPENDFAREVALAVKRIESGISALEVSSRHSDVLRASPSKMGYKSKASESTMQESEIQSQVPGRNVKAIVDRLELLSRPVNQTSQLNQYVQGLRLPPSQNQVAKRPPTGVKMSSRNIKDDAGRNWTADKESTAKSVKSKPSMPRKSVGATVSVRPNHKLPRQEDAVRKWTAHTESTTKSVKSRPSVVSLRNKQRHAVLRPTLLDDKTSIPYHNPTTYRRQRPLPHNLESEESSSDSSYNSQPYSNWTSEQTSTSTSGSEDDSASQRTSDSSSEYCNPSNLGPMSKMGPVVGHRSADLANQRKATGRLRRLRNKLGLIFHHHHHHHHHHHVKGDNSGHTTSMWKNFRGIFHHDSKPKVDERQAIGKVRNAVAKEQVGHFHTLVHGLQRHTRHSKKSRPSKGGMEGLSSTRMEKKLHWWQKLKRNKGVRLPNRGRAKIRITGRQPQRKLKKMSKHKLLTHK